MKYDLHTHSKYSSDGILKPESMVKLAKKKGLSGIAVTDHNTIRGGLEAKKHETDDLKVIIGSEVMTDRGEIIGLFLSEEIKATNFNEVVDEIKEQEGLVIVPHPFDLMRTSSFKLQKEDIKKIDCIEIFNSRCVNNQSNIEAAEFAKFYKLGTTGGSDAHFGHEIGNSGITIMDEDVRKSILNENMLVFGKRSRSINHVFTKMLKTYRKHF
ncbi:PHP domain-containing protein [Methanobacterium sp. ACI-7]|uniref:PHP domain-containing protein n=1 Tax=unclassified Methanobacterium TaxID=2627676 RepID=UPI0039C3DD37